VVGIRAWTSRHPVGLPFTKTRTEFNSLHNEASEVIQGRERLVPESWKGHVSISDGLCYDPIPIRRVSHAAVRCTKEGP
jgi:hypothetical protein